MGKILKLEQIQREELAEKSKDARPFQTWKLLIVYARQSTVNQFINNKESQQEQALDLLDYGARLGWPEELRLLFIENLLADGTIKNASGRLRIDEREGLQAVFDYIKQGIVGAVLVSAVDRLFRDETLIQAAVFADVCKQYGVQILTWPDGDVFDFNVPRRNDLEDFLDAAKEAANYLKHIRMMHRRRDRKALRGEYAGGSIPTGFMLDGERKHRNYVPNPLWAPIMAKLFRHFRVDLHGDYNALRKEVLGQPIFPELPEEIRARVGRIGLTKVPGGYTFHSWAGLRDALKNPAYIGHKLVKGRLIKDSHQGIVDEQDWRFAFDIASNTDLDGNERRKIERAVRKPKSALLSGVRKDGRPTVQSRQGNVYVFTPENKPPAYAIKHFDTGTSEFIASITVNELDAMFEEILLVRLKEVGERGVTNSPYNELCKAQETALVSVHESIARARKEHARLQREHDVNFDQMSDKELRENKAARNELLRQLRELEQKVKDAEAERQDYYEVDCLLRDAGKTWAKKTLSEKQRYIRIITTSIWLEEYAPGWLKLQVFWSPIMGLLDHNVCVIWQQNGGKGWSDEENAILKANYASKSRGWLIEALPYRSWQAIRTQAYRKHVQRGSLREEYAELPDWLCLADAEAMKPYPGFRIERGDTLVYRWCVIDIKEHEVSSLQRGAVPP